MADFYTVGEAARLLGVRRESVRGRLDNGKIKGEHTWGKEGGHWRIPKPEIDRLLAERGGSTETADSRQQTANGKGEEMPETGKQQTAESKQPAAPPKAKTVIVNRARKKVMPAKSKQQTGNSKQSGEEALEKESQESPKQKNQPASAAKQPAPAPKPGKGGLFDDYSLFDI